LGNLNGEVFTGNRPVATFDEALKIFRSWKTNTLFPFMVLRRSFLLELTGWLDAMTGFEPANRSLLFGLFHAPKATTSSTSPPFP